LLAATTKNTAFINHPKDILHDENHLYGIVLILNIVSKTRNTFKWLDIKIANQKVKIRSASVTAVVTLETVNNHDFLPQ